MFLKIKEAHMDFSDIMIPNEDVATHIAFSLLNESIFSMQRLKHGSQNYVYQFQTLTEDYVIRLTTADNLQAFESAIYWQFHLAPLEIGLVPYIACDLTMKHSPFPALILPKVHAKDLTDIYLQMSLKQKQDLAIYRNQIQNKVQLIKNKGFGFSYGISDPPKHDSWFKFLENQIRLREESFIVNSHHPISHIHTVYDYLQKMKPFFETIKSHGLLWDVTDRNILVKNFEEVFLIDIEELCFGDSLLPIGLTYVSLEMNGMDLLYPDAWLQTIKNDTTKEIRIAFYRLFYTFWMMGRPVISKNGTIRHDNATLLKKMFDEACERLNKCFQKYN
jgi:hypothetical protein